jgi:hypothetical protein
LLPAATAPAAVAKPTSAAQVNGIFLPIVIEEFAYSSVSYRQSGEFSLELQRFFAGKNYARRSGTINS